MTQTIPLASGPRSQRNGNSTGSYELVVRLASSVLDPGETLSLEIFFTGYGEISQAKLLFFPSTAIFEIGSCWAGSGIGQSADGKLIWGGMKDPLLSSSGAGIIVFKGLGRTGWLEETCFFDVNAGDHVISTEMKFGGKAPFELSLQTVKQIKPGKYYVEFGFTYYDGQKWRTNTKRAEFTVRSFLERHQQKIAFWGVAASATGLLLSASRFFV